MRRRYWKRLMGLRSRHHHKKEIVTVAHHSKQRSLKPILALAGTVALIVLICLGVSEVNSRAGAADPPAKNKQKKQKKDSSDKRDKKQKGSKEKDIRKKTPVEVFMRSKLSDNSAILEGLMTNDFEPIKEAADHLILMSKATEWHVIQGPIYKQHSVEFRRAAERLKRDAEKENLDAAALDYVHMTMACVSCHKFVRGTQLADGRDPLPIQDGLKISQANPFRALPKTDPPAQLKK